MKIYDIFRILIISFLLSSSHVVLANNVPPTEYTTWLNNLKEEMQDRGISKATIESAFSKNYYHKKHNVIKQDRNQNEFILTTSDYLKRVITEARVKKGRDFYKKLSKRYPNGVKGVPLHYLIAFWGIETNFGAYQGGFNAIEALTILSYDTRRPKFFREELYNVLKIIDEGHITIDKIESSWAGALGNFQFMPSTFNNYAVDANNDGKIDIWNNFDDAITSAGNYLSQIGWIEKEKWGTPVDVSWNFDYKNSGRNLKKTIKEWKRLGVNIKGFDENTEASLIFPEGYRGQGYLIFSNFHVIMQWNKSENYALAVGLLADRIKNGKLSYTVPMARNYKLTSVDIKKIQQFINKQKIANIKIDGYLGSQTRGAIQILQKRFKLPADGYPNYALLEKIKRFSQIGYIPSIPSTRVHKDKQVSLRRKKNSINLSESKANKENIND